MSPRSLVVYRLSITFQAGRVQPVVAVTELDHAPDSIADGGVVVGDEILQGLHETSLHVTSLGSLDGGIDQTFTTGDGVEEELCGVQAGVKTVPYKSLRRRISRLLGEVGERAVLETIWNTVAGDNLLSDTGHHLRDVDDGTCERRQVTRNVENFGTFCIPFEPQVAIIRGAL